MAIGIRGSNNNARTPIPTPRTGAMKSLEAPSEVQATDPKPVDGKAPVEELKPLAPTPASADVVAETRGRVAASGETLRQNLELAQQRFNTDAHKFVSTVTSAVADGKITRPEGAEIGKEANTLNLDGKQVQLAQARVDLDNLKTSIGDGTPSRRQRMELRSAQTRVASLENVVRAMGGDPSVQAPQPAPTGTATTTGGAGQGTLLPETPAKTAIPFDGRRQLARADFAQDMNAKRSVGARTPIPTPRTGSLK